MEINHEKVVAAAASSNKSAPLMKKEVFCKYCNKKFGSYQALGGHHNSHKAEREAEKQNKILSKASAYYKKSSVNSNHAYAYGYGGKTLGVSPLSMTPFKPFCYMGVTHDYQHVAAWPGQYQILNPPQPTMYQFMAEGSGFHQNHKSYQPSISSIGPNSGSQSQPNHIHTFMTDGSASHQQYKSHQPLISCTVGEGPTNSGSRPHSSHPSLCDKGNFGLATDSSMIHQKAIIEGSDLNVKTSCDHENSAPENSSSSVNGAVENLDLTLKI